MTNINLSLALTSSPSSPRMPIVIDSETATGKKLFDQVLEVTKIPAASLRLIFRGRIIPATDDTELVVEKFKLEEGTVIHCMGKPASGATAAVPASAAPATVATAAATPATTTNLSQALAQFKQANAGSGVADTGLKTLGKILDNIANNPTEEKYRQLKCANAAFMSRLGGLPKAEELLLACGFTKEGEVFKLVPSAEKWELLQQAKAAVTLETTSTPASIFGGAGLGAAAPRPGVPSPPEMMNNPMMQQMMNDPNAMAQMLNNPMVQQMMDNDPRMGSDPRMRQAMDQLRSNPAMLQQVTQMMSDPNMRSRMAQMMGNIPGGAGAGAGSGAGGLTPQAMQQAMANMARMGQQQQQQRPGGAAAPAPSGGGNNDEEMTEEEMIQQAIERSLREQ